MVKFFWYGLLIKYHMRKNEKMPRKYQTVIRYHYEMVQYYYEKMTGKKWEDV